MASEVKLGEKVWYCGHEMTVNKTDIYRLVADSGRPFYLSREEFTKQSPEIAGAKKEAIMMAKRKFEQYALYRTMNPKQIENVMNEVLTDIDDET